MTNRKRTQRRFDETYIASPRGARELVFTRTFDAPIERVWMALTTPEHIPHWWGPHGSTTTVVAMDVRVKGGWRFICTEAGEQHAFRGEYIELSPYGRLVQTFEYEPIPGTVIETTTLLAREGVTEMTVVSTFPSTEDRDNALESGMADGTRQGWERLADLLETLKEA